MAIFSASTRKRTWATIPSTALLQSNLGGSGNGGNTSSTVTASAYHIRSLPLLKTLAEELAGVIFNAAMVFSKLLNLRSFPFRTIKPWRFWEWREYIFHSDRFSLPYKAPKARGEDLVNPKV
jgi:hypothetical protein